MGLLESLLAQNQPAAPSPLAPSGDGQASLPQVAQQQAEATGMPPSMANQHTRGMLKQMLTRFAYGMGQSMTKSAGLPTDQEIANDQAQRAHLKAQTDMVDAQRSQMGQMVTVNGVTMPYPLALKVYGAMITGQSREKVQGLKNEGALDTQGLKNEGSLDTQGLKNEGVLDQVAAKEKTQEEFQKDYKAALDAGDTKKADAALAGYTALKGVASTKPPSKDDRYIAIQQQRALGKPLSPDDAAYEVAYRGWNKLSKIDPGVARANAFNAGRYIPMIDPSDPEKVSLFRAADAAREKLGSPQSIAYQTDKAMTKYMTSGKGGANITAFNTATAHLGTLGEVASALNNGDIQGLNRLGNWYAHQTGNPAPTNFETVKSAVAGELANTFKTSGATDPEIAQITATINNANSPKAIAGAITYYQNLLGSKVEALQGQYEMGRAGKPNLPPKQVTNGMNAAKVRNGVGAKSDPLGIR